MKNLSFLLLALITALLPYLGQAAPTDNNRPSASNSEPAFSWSAHRKLRWQDFQGMAPAQAQQHVAAITACGIGYYTNSVTPREKPVITVYNAFYMQDSWVRHEAADERVLTHEQGHFDLCEVYTRKFRALVARANISGANMKTELERIYNAVNREYEMRQQAYETETQHGTVAAAQQRWTEQIQAELGETQYWASR